MNTISIRISAIVMTIAFTVCTGTEGIHAQTHPEDTQLFFNVSGRYGTLDRDFNNIGPGIRTVSSGTSWDVMLSFNPTWWLGERTAVELELGYWASSIKTETDGVEQSISNEAGFIMPHFLLSLGSVDSLLVPYVKAGVGLLSIEEEDVPLGFSAGIGTLILSGSPLIMKIELSYKLKSANSGSHVVTETQWQGLFVTAGVGIEI
ncbi:hypothetical protein KQI65_06970 [bacterium]|nr:hypothetical protein [bacterium]